MPYAQLNERGRMTAWSHEKAEGFDVEFSNGDYVDENCVDGLDDFVVVDGEAVFSPSPEKELAKAKKKLAQAGWLITAMMLDAMSASNQGQMFKVFSSYREKYGEEFAECKEWLAKLDELTE